MGATADDERGPQEFAALPDPIRPEDTVAMKDTTVAPDPTMGRDTETEFMLRNAG
jgi:hypothetical protein